MGGRIILQGDLVKLRQPELEDLDVLLSWENDPAFWNISHTLAPFSKIAMQRYIEGASADILTAKQLRLMMVDRTDFRCVGAIDLFDYDPVNARAGVGILIGLESDRHQGYATDALRTVIHYAGEILQLHQLYAHIFPENTASIRLFERCGFQHTGTRKDWVKLRGAFQDEWIFQRIGL
jgi:diamine N-acetyltransferase